MNRRRATACFPVVLALAMSTSAGCQRIKHWLGQNEPGESAPPPASARKSVAELLGVSGAVTVRGADGKTRPAQGSLYADEVVETGPDGHATVRFADGREVAAEPNARFSVGQSAGALSVRIERGIVVARTPAAGAAGGAGGLTLEMLSPFGVSRVMSGSSVRFDIGVDQELLEVSMGQISYTRKNGASETAGAGDKLEVKLGSIDVVRAKKPEPAVIEMEPIKVLISAEHGAVMVKPEGGKAYAKVARTPVEVGEGTAYRVADKASAVLTSAALQARLAAGAKGVVGKSEKQGGVERHRLRLDSGSTRVRLGGGGHRELALSGPGGEVVLGVGEETFADITQTPHGPTVELLTGQAEVTAHGETQSVKAGTTAVVNGNKPIKLSSTGKASVSVTAARRMTVYANDLRRLALVLPDGTAGRRVELASDSGFRDVILGGRIFNPYLNLTPPARGDLYWRVLDDDGKPTSHRGQLHFEPDHARSALDLPSPHAEVTETGLKATVYFQSVLPSLTFTWAPTDGAKKYELNIFAPPDLKTPIVHKVVGEAKADVEAGPLGEGSYVWMATPRGDGGRELKSANGGRANKLDLTYHNAMISLAIASPKPGERVTGKDVAVRGAAPAGARLWINGQPAKLDGKGRFDMRVPVSDAVVFRLMTKDGESVCIRSLRAGR